MTEFHFARFGTLINVAGIIVGASVTLDPISRRNFPAIGDSFAAFLNKNFSGD